MECCGIASYTVMWAETVNPGGNGGFPQCREMFCLSDRNASVPVVHPAGLLCEVPELIRVGGRIAVLMVGTCRYAATVKNVTRMYAQKLPGGGAADYEGAWRLFIETDAMKRDKDSERACGWQCCSLGRVDLEPRGSLPRGDAAAGRVRVLAWEAPGKISFRE